MYESIGGFFLFSNTIQRAKRRKSPKTRARKFTSQPKEEQKQLAAAENEHNSLRGEYPSQPKTQKRKKTLICVHDCGNYAKS